MKVTYKVEQNQYFGDFRVNKYLNGEWVNQAEGRWSKYKAEQKAKMYRALTKNGFTTMNDRF